MDPEVTDDAHRPGSADAGMAGAGKVGDRRWRPWWAAPRLDPLAGPVVWVWAAMAASVTGVVGMAVDRPTPRTLAVAVVVGLMAVVFVGITVARRRRRDLVFLTARPVTPVARLLRSAAVVIVIGTAAGLFVMGQDTGWAPVAVLATGLAVTGLLLGLAHRLDVRAADTS